MKAVVTGMIATYPVGGVVWDYGQYALGLEQLGFDVTYLEDTGWKTYDPGRREYGDDCTAGVTFLAAELAKLSPTLGRRWHFRHLDGTTYGLEPAELEARVAEADVFLNVSGGTLLRDAYLRSRRKVLVDSDPGWNHFRNYPRWDAHPSWHGTHGYRAHDHFFTYAERLGRPDCVLPALGLDWRPTRPPVVLDRWGPEGPGARWTTVMTWKNFQETVEHAGVTYGTKEREFGRIEDLPRRTAGAFEVAVGGDPPAQRWRTLGWSVRDAHEISHDADAYRAYVQGSRGELSVAKHMYVATRSGWFSCRSVCYLAAGRPVVTQDTGFSEVVPAGEGLLAFTDGAGARAAVEAVERDYAGHAEAARALARSQFDAKRVLEELLGRIGVR